MSERDGDKAARHLREGILRLDYRPGQILDEAEVSERLRVSRTPVREALIQLIADGLVVRDGRKARVAPLDLDGIPQLYDALLISSRLIQRLAAENRTDKDLARIRVALERFEQATHQGGGVERSEANQAFHLAISQAAGNRYFQAFYDPVLMATIRLARACFAEDRTGNADLAAHLAETRRQHRLIHDAIEARDVDEADRLAVLHHDLTRDRVRAVLFEGRLTGGADLDLGLEA